MDIPFLSGAMDLSAKDPRPLQANSEGSDHTLRAQSDLSFRWPRMS